MSNEDGRAGGCSSDRGVVNVEVAVLMEGKFGVQL